MAIDIEQGLSGDTAASVLFNLFQRFIRLFKIPPVRESNIRHSVATTTRDNVSEIRIEDSPKGYPRFSSLMAAHGSFQIFRRFSDLRTRLLLLTQDEIVELEEQLNYIDSTEQRPLFLASRRDDRNPQRADITSKLRTSLAAYDGLLDGSQRALGYEKPHAKYVTSLQNWLTGNACIARVEAKFLASGNDLLTLYPKQDGIVSWLERALCDKIMSRFSKGTGKYSNDSHVHIFSRSSTKRVTRAILSPLIVFLLLAPVVICNMIDSSSTRLSVMILATATFVCCMSMMTNAKTVELAVAGATYATVLVVFVSGTDSK